MAISKKLKGFLDQSKIRYTITKHPVAYTAQEIAAAQHVPGRQLAKSVLVNTNAGPVLACLPAIHLVDLKKLKALVKAKRLSIGKESDIKRIFPDIEIGAMSPFGNLYDVPVIADRALGTADEIVFNGGSHTETIKMRYADFSTLVKPRVGNFALPRTTSNAARAKPARKTPRTRVTARRPAKRNAARRPQPRRHTRRR